uniref:RWD domain-containing protein n=1 Tax=Corethron hystrix TaxID=216773 RepID=A0A7S1BFY5_9STRA|mmetsp:Transcript_25447/g.58715  ORF Transcript_25447/g.58715 Transcript_25447/m.58715 type:complete len:497 (+) Transcript_25447:159-1649(+)
MTDLDEDTAIIPDEEHAQQMVDELVALSLIYSDEFQLLSPTERATDAGEDCNAFGEDVVYKHPIVFTVRLHPPVGEISHGASISEPSPSVSPCLSEHVRLRVEYPPSYPDTPPLLSLEHNCGDVDLSACLDVVRKAAHEDIGTPHVMMCVQAGHDFFEAGGLASLKKVACISSAVDESGCEGKDWDLLENMHRPLLRIVLLFLDVMDMGRLCIASRSIRDFLERRAERDLRNFVPLQLADDNFAWNDSAIMTVEGERVLAWKREKERVAEKLRSYREQLYVGRRTIDFCFFVNDKPEVWEWRLREGLGQGDDPPVKFKENGHSWIKNPYNIHCICSTRFISPKTHFYKVRVRMSASAYDGDISIGIVTDEFDLEPSVYFETESGGGFGALNQNCALINVMSGGSFGGHLEADLGLIVDADLRMLTYGIPLGAFQGRAIFNNGQFVCPMDFVGRRLFYLTVLVARKKEQTNFYGSVSFREVSEKEWHREMVVPYNLL